MKVRRYLNQIYELSHKIETRQEQLDEISHMMFGLKAMEYDKDKVSTSAAGDRMYDMVGKYLDMTQNLVELIDYYIKTKDTIIGEIHDIDDNKYMMILDYRYIKCYKFEKIAIEMNYDYDYVKSLHKKALKAFIDAHPEKNLALNDLADI